MRLVGFTTFIVCLSVSPAPSTINSDSSSQVRVGQTTAPTLKKQEKKQAPAPTITKRYDRARNQTYVSIVIPLLNQSEETFVGPEGEVYTAGLS
ncbi:MAG: hypothetical protein WCD76_01470, partial [Pyrinomonadaceae bacterium]